jgi:hypothetical protein
VAATVAYRRAAIFLLLLSSAGCLASDAKPCGEMICPSGRVCARGGTCVDESLATACLQLTDGESCTVPMIGNGSCQDRLCIVGRCGDGVINAIDACDGEELGGKTCMDFGSVYADGLKCSADCSYDKTGCAGYCGDGVRQASEECDGADFGGKTCITEGFYRGAAVCTADCKINLGGCNGRCGDGIRNSFTEQCDGADFGDSTCELREFLGEVVPLKCTPECALDVTSCTCGGDRCARLTQRCVLSDGIYTCEDVQ